MTQRGFDQGDNSQGSNGPNTDLHALLLSDSIGSPIRRVNSEAESAQAGVDALRQNAERMEAATAEPQTEAQRKLATAFEAYTAVGDDAAAKKEALKEGAPIAKQFEDAIKTADAQFAKTVEQAKKEGAELRPKYLEATMMKAMNQMALQAAVEQVPAAERGKVESLLNAYPNLDPKDPIRQAIVIDFEKYPGLNEAASNMEASIKDPTIARVEELQQELQVAMGDRVMTRMGYGEALNDSGDELRAFNQMKEAAAILGIKIPDEAKPGPRTLEARHIIAGGNGRQQAFGI